jgi:hypothetical protein
MGCCCCRGNHKAAEQQSTCDNAPVKGINAQSDHSCQASISAQVAVQHPVVKAADQQPPMLDVIPQAASVASNTASLTASEFNTGPPLDLVVKLRRLVI